MELSKILLAATILYGDPSFDPVDDFVCVRQVEDQSYVAEFETEFPLYITLNGEIVYTQAGNVIQQHSDITGPHNYESTAETIEGIIAGNNAYIALRTESLNEEANDVDPVLLGNFLNYQAIISVQHGEYAEALRAIDESMEQGFAHPECVYNGLV